MHAKLFSLAILAAVVLAGPGGIGSITCNVGSLQCCDSVQDASSEAVKSLIGLLGISLGSVTGQVGINCTPISGLGPGGNGCPTQLACCTGSNFNGFIAVGCSPPNVNN